MYAKTQKDKQEKNKDEVYPELGNANQAFCQNKKAGK